MYNRSMSRSPFPGMDPYLERRWGDVHLRLCAHVSAALQPILPAGLRARGQERVILETMGGERLQSFEADGLVLQGSHRESGESEADSVATVEPVYVRHIPRLIRDRWIHILDTKDRNRVITAIEILSPGNKAAGTLNRRYRRKLERYTEAGVNIVEIDLLRSSRKRLEVRTEELPPEKRAAYLTCVQRATDEETWEVYPMPLRQPLPVVPIPCRPTDGDVPLALQPIIERIYVEGGHDDIDYSRPPSPPLGPEDEAWARQLVGAAGRG